MSGNIIFTFLRSMKGVLLLSAFVFLSFSPAQIQAEKKTTASALKKQDTLKRAEHSGGTQPLAFNSSGKRSPANTYNCKEFFEDKHSVGYVQLGIECAPGERLCIAVFRIERNTCTDGVLKRHYCEPKNESLYDSEKIKCPGGCDPSGLFCAPKPEVVSQAGL